MAEPIKFYLDEHVHPAVAKGLRRRDVDVVTTGEAELLSESDDVQLNWAFKEGRVIFTQDEDFFRLHAAGLTHAGIVFAHQLTGIGKIIEGLALIAEVLTPAEMNGQVEYL